MTTALVGYSGFVGQTIRKQFSLDEFFRSNNIETIKNKEFDLCVCAAAPAQKWLANRDPISDRQNIDSLISHLDSIKCQNFILISTVDVFKDPINVDEETPVDEQDLHPYGLNRRYLETFVESRFSKHLIVRLPGLVGPGLRKNIIFDFLNDNNLDAIDSRNIFQFYPMVNLWYDIQTALELQLNLVHLTAEPISVSDVARDGFGKAFTHTLPRSQVCYDFKSIYGKLFNGHSAYQYSRRETLQAIRAYAQSEPTAQIKTGADA
ncbi:hypothetical protein [Nodosilinea sp. E11]|uniref:hypothetical protein n=1 Tax=Nodosilinea sp. E11 TaxID=3037479 RepID=UPI002934EE2B|nr:hypothetical protein [Nodosilinea sp. E11]WOD40421.1 hypothetical protein RRF56_06395 [Nodosilinea sp. E11]